MRFVVVMIWLGSNNQGDESGNSWFCFL